MIAMVVTETANITPSMLPPMTTTGDCIALFSSEFERSLVGVALVGTEYVVLATGISCGARSLVNGLLLGTEVGVAKEEECSLLGVVKYFSVGVVNFSSKGVVLEASVVVAEDEGSGRSIIGEVVGVVNVERGVAIGREGDETKSAKTEDLANSDFLAHSLTIACDPNILAVITLTQTPPQQLTLR